MSRIHHGDGGPIDSLTEREREIIRLWTGGKTDKQIAGKLDISVETIKSHAKHILLKLHVHNRTEACYKFWLSQQKQPPKRK